MASNWAVLFAIEELSDYVDIYIPVMVRLEAAARGARITGRAALTAIWEARREATTREAIVKVV